jgi:hypothetical protein
MNKRVALVSAVMVAALVAAIYGATAALQLIGTFSPGGSPLSEADVRTSLAAAPRTPATSPGRSASPHSSKTASSGQVRQTGARSFNGNSVFASCAGSQARLTSWIPAGGYSTDGSSQGPARAVWVKFKSASSEITVTVTCAGGGPHFATSSDDRGGGHGGGGSGGGGSGH